MNLSRYRLSMPITLDGENPPTTRSFAVGTEDVQAIEVTGGGVIVRREPARRDLILTASGYGWLEPEKAPHVNRDHPPNRAQKR